jgi:hypothetical protein
MATLRGVLPRLQKQRVGQMWRQQTTTAAPVLRGDVSFGGDEEEANLELALSTRLVQWSEVSENETKVTTFKAM